MRQIFVNLPVKDLKRSKKFFAGLGFGHIWELLHMRGEPRAR